jgi:hypothetical protein
LIGKKKPKKGEIIKKKIKKSSQTKQITIKKNKTKFER